DMCNHPAFKKGADTSFGLIQELMRDDDLARLKRLLHAADRADRDYPLHTDLLERINVGAVVDLGWREVVMASVTREKDDSRSFQIADDQSIRWLAKGRPHPEFFDVGEALHLIEAAAGDDRDSRLLASLAALHSGHPGRAGDALMLQILKDAVRYVFPRFLLIKRQPVHVRITSEPRHLPLGKVAGVPLQPTDSLLISVPALAIPRDLPVSQRLHGPQMLAVATVQESLRLLDHSILDFASYPGVNSPIQRRAIHHQPDHHGWKGALQKAVAPVPFRERLSC